MPISPGWNRKPGGNALQEIDLLGREEPPPTRLEALEGDWPYGHARESHDLVTELGEHAADFAILAFCEDQLHDRRIPLLGDRTGTLGANLPLGEPHAVDQFLEDFGRRYAGHYGSVDLLYAELRVSQPIGHLTIVGQEHEASAHLVETSHRVDSLGDVRDQVDHSGTS